jgi:hypothetical protein
MFNYRRALSSDAVVPTKDYKLDAAYAGVAKKGDIVALNAAGEVVAAAADAAAVLGVFVGKNIKIENDTTETGKVMGATGLVFEADVVGTPVVGGAYGLGLTAGDYFVDVAEITVKLFKVVAVRDNGNVDVVITGYQIA